LIDAKSSQSINLNPSPQTEYIDTIDSITNKRRVTLSSADVKVLYILNKSQSEKIGQFESINLDPGVQTEIIPASPETTFCTDCVRTCRECI
jgi:hypothetical protein